MILFYGLFQLFNDDSVFIARYRYKIRFIKTHTLHVSEKSGFFNKNNIAGINYCFAQKIHRLRRPRYR